MSEMTDRYEKDIIDKLFALEREGKGQLVELASVDLEGRTVPFVAFQTGTDVVVTARHHVNEFLGPTETVMELAKSAQEGFTLIPVVDYEHFAWSEGYKERLLGGEFEMLGSTPHVIYEMYQGYKGMRPTNAKKDWDDYRYVGDTCSPQIAAIKRLIGESSLLIDLHNSLADKYLGIIVASQPDMDLTLAGVASSQLQQTAEVGSGYNDKPLGRELAPGIYHYRDRAVGQGITASHFAASLGILNLVLEIPSFQQIQDKPHILRDALEVVNTSASLVSTLGGLVA